MPQSIFTFLMFEGTAEAAMNFYVSLFRGSEIKRAERYGPGEAGVSWQYSASVSHCALPQVNEVGERSTSA